MHTLLAVALSVGALPPALLFVLGGR